MEGIPANLLEQLNFRWKVIRIQYILNADLFCKMLLLNLFASLVWLPAWPSPVTAVGCQPTASSSLQPSPVTAVGCQPTASSSCNLALLLL